MHSIRGSLELGLYDNARFLAERLVAATPASEVCVFELMHCWWSCCCCCWCRWTPHSPTTCVRGTPPCVLQAHQHLLATCYKHCNQAYRAVQLLKGAGGDSLVCGARTQDRAQR